MLNLILETSFEELHSRFSEQVVNTKLMEFVEPLPETEAEINEIATSLTSAGKLTFLLGRPGTGKSTFIQSLSWRPHLRLARLVSIDANAFTFNQTLLGLFNEFERIGKDAEQIKDKGPTCVVINYLENLVDFEPEEVKGFFRRLNGLLRQRPLLIIWPVTQQDDIEQMRDYARDVSGTLFYRTKEVLGFTGPAEAKFVDIAKRTISVLNEGRELSDFSLTTDDLEEVLVGEFARLPLAQRNLREYLELIKERWRKTTKYQEKLREYIPKSTEIWFVFSFDEAELVTSQFVRKSQRIEDNWSAIHDKFFEYVHSNTQRSSIWNAKRLQLALYGAIKTRVMFLPTNTLVSCVAAYSTNPKIQSLLSKNNLPAAWKDKANAKRTLSRTALCKQAIGELVPSGKRKGGPAAVAMTQAVPVFEALVDWIVNGGSDKEVNSCIGTAMSEELGFAVVSDKTHPWIPNVIPDLFMDLGHCQVCVEFHHTTKKEPGVVADYVLKKLNIYMNQLEQLMSIQK